MTLASGTAVYVLLSLFMVAACALVALLLPLMTRGMCALYAKIRGTAPGYIAARSSVNSPACSRTATALALLICFMFVAMSLVDSVKALSSSSYGRFAADYIATLPTDAPLSREDATELKNELAALEETNEVIIATSLTNYYPLGPTNDLQTLTVTGLLEGKALYRFCRGIDEETVRRFDETEYPVVINYQLALAMGLSVGDALPVDGMEVSLPEGADLTVVGIDTTVSSFDSYCYSVYGICSRNDTQLYLDSGDPARAREILEARGFDFYEGKNYYIDQAHFSYSGNRVSVKLHQRKNLQHDYYGEYDSTLCVFDMLTIMARARSWDASTLRPGDKIRFLMADGENVEKELLLYRGKETIESKDGHHYRCLVFSFYEDNDEDRDRELIRFFITDDRNHLPIRLDMNLNFGSAKAFMHTVRGNRYPLTARVK